MAGDNKMLGEFSLEGIPSAPRGVPQIEVTFDIDANGIVNVSARDKATGKEQKIRIQASGGLSDTDIQRMVKDAEEHAAEDQKRKAQIEARNRAEALAHSAEKSLQEHGDKVSEEDRKAVEVALADVRTTLADETADEEALAPKVQALATASMKIGRRHTASSRPRPSRPSRPKRPTAAGMRGTRRSWMPITRM